MALARIGWLILPVLAAGLAHVAVLKMDALRALAVPLDGGLTWRGRPLLGPNKTWRGVVIMPAVSGLVLTIQGSLARRNAAIARIATIDRVGVDAAFAGAIYGLGYVLGELPNSFVKRQMGIPPGARARSAWLQYAVDQLDSVVGCVVALRTFHRPSRADVAGAVALGSGAHVAIDILLHFIGVKGRRR